MSTTRVTRSTPAWQVHAAQTKSTRSVEASLEPAWGPTVLAPLAAPPEAPVQLVNEVARARLAAHVGGPASGDPKTNADVMAARERIVAKRSGKTPAEHQANVALLEGELHANLAKDPTITRVKADVLTQPTFDREVMVPAQAVATGLVLSNDATPGAEADIASWLGKERWPSSQGVTGHTVGVRAGVESDGAAAREVVAFLDAHDDGVRHRKVFITGHYGDEDWATEGGKGVHYADGSVLDARDSDAWAAIGAKLRAGDRVVIQSCSLANSADDQRAYARMVQEHFPPQTALYLSNGLASEMGGSQHGWTRFIKTTE